MRVHEESKYVSMQAKLNKAQPKSAGPASLHEWVACHTQGASASGAPVAVESEAPLESIALSLLLAASGLCTIR